MYLVTAIATVNAIFIYAILGIRGRGVTVVELEVSKAGFSPYKIYSIGAA